MNPFRTLKARAVVLPWDDVDTDQIIPARFLKCTTKDDLGRHLFADWRTTADGSPNREFALEKPEARGAQILVAGANFGCGSSREHAPWALAAWGFRVVVARSFGDIFRANALKNGLVPVALEEADHIRVMSTLLAQPGAELTVDVTTSQVTVEGTRAPFPLDPFARHCLVEGVDELGYLLSFSPRIDAFERGLSHG